jgi:putative aldouronate transport system substrate-binding protein
MPAEPLSRRQIIRLGLGVGVGVTASTVLGACGGDAGDSASSGSRELKLPSFTPPRELPGTTISSFPDVAPAYDAYPRPPFKSVANPPITSGKPVTTFQILFPAPPPPVDRNPYWQEMNKRLGGELRPTLAPYQSYGEKLQTTIASGDMPDIVFVEPGQNAQAVVRTFKEGAFTDLTDILGGDGVKKFPNLAQVPTASWKHAAIEGRLYGVPKPLNQLIADAGFAYRMDWAEKAGMTSKPKNADELVEFLKALSGNGRWALGAMYPRWFLMMYRAPNNWRLGSDGKLVYYVESDELEPAVQFINKLWKAGVFHPDAPTQAWSPQAEDLFLSDKVASVGGNFGSHFGRRGTVGNFRNAHPGVEIGHLMPMGFDGGKPAIFQRQALFGQFCIPAKVGKDSARLEELLRVLDYTGAPFGSEEFLFMTFGIEGRHYTKDPQGNPVAVPQGPVTEEIGINYFNQPSEAVFYFPGVPGDSVAAQKWVEEAAPNWIPDPTWGLISDTNNRKAAALRQLEDDYLLGVATGRRPMSDLKVWRDEWRKGGGEDIRREFQESLERSSG